MFHFLNVSPRFQKRQRGNYHVVADFAAMQNNTVRTYRHFVAYLDASDKLRLSFRCQFMGAVRVDVNATSDATVLANLQALASVYHAEVSYPRAFANFGVTENNC
jgi:hypothetical protein